MPLGSYPSSHVCGADDDDIRCSTHGRGSSSATTNTSGTMTTSTMTRISPFGARRWPAITAILLCLVSFWTPTAMARDLDLCATFNTAEGDLTMDIFMTVGLCFDTCKGSTYAYGVVNYQSCWCTSYVPDESTQLDLSKCNRSCPGFPDEKCGGTSSNIFGYVGVGVAPQGTKAPVSSTTSTSQTSTTSDPTSSPSSIVTSVVTDGTTVTTAPTDAAGATDPDSSRSDDGGLSTGQVVGIIVGVIGAIAIIAVALVCWFITRRRRDQDAIDSERSQRSNSTGFAGTSDMGESGSAFPPALGLPWHRSGPSAGTVGSRLSEVDPRMDPLKGGLYARSQSHESLNTLQDNHDYSRRVHQPKVLRATNPDPDQQPDE